MIAQSGQDARAPVKLIEAMFYRLRRSQMFIETGTPEEGRLGQERLVAPDRAGAQVIALGYKHFVPMGLKSRIVRVRKS